MVQLQINCFSFQISRIIISPDISAQFKFICALNVYVSKLTDNSSHRQTVFLVATLARAATFNLQVALA